MCKVLLGSCEEVVQADHLQHTDQVRNTQAQETGTRVQSTLDITNKSAPPLRGSF
jgi:hypothetical protein